MSFKLTPPFEKNPPPVVNVPMEEGVLGRADKKGCILVNKDIKEIVKTTKSVNTITGWTWFIRPYIVNKNICKYGKILITARDTNVIFFGMHTTIHSIIPHQYIYLHI